MLMRRPGMLAAVASGGGVGALDADVVTWAAAVVTNGGTVSPGRSVLVSSFVTALKAASVWTLIDDAWLLVAGNSVQALTSLKQLRLATVTAAPTFTTDRGYAFNGSTQYVSTGFVPSTHAVSMTGTNMHISAYERTNATSAGVAAGAFNFSNQGLSINPRNAATGALGVVLNSPTSGPGGDVLTDSRGLSVGSRNGTLAADVLAYKNGVAVAPYAAGTPTAVLTTRTILIGAQMNNSSVAASFRAATEGFVSVGAAIPAGSQPAFYSAVQAFMTSVGANV